MKLLAKINNMRSQIFPKLPEQKSPIEIAKSENLDEFVALEVAVSGIIEYSTVHGCRILSSDAFSAQGFANGSMLKGYRPELNLFVVLKKGEGFAKAVTLPYVYWSSNKFQHPELVVCCPAETLVEVGYAKAVALPYRKSEQTGAYPAGTLVVCAADDNDEAISAGYASAVPIAMSKSDTCIEDLQMLDTDYAASLVDFPRFR